MKKRLNNQGFSLVEILGVIVILSILLTMGLYSFSRNRKNSADKSYEMMSKNAVSAAEEYFMDHVFAKEVSIDTLVEKKYLEAPVDPLFKDEICSGNVSVIGTNSSTSEDGIDSDTYKVVIRCKKHKSCDVYPSNLTCDADGGIITDGSSSYYSVGLAGHDFQNTISLVIRLQFNEFPNRNLDFFGNWEGGGGGFRLLQGNRNLAFNLYSLQSSSYFGVISDMEARINKWYIIVGVLDGTNMNLYMNGILTATRVWPGGNIKVSEKDIIVGGNPDNGGISYPANITVSNVLVFDKALTQDDVNNYFNKPNESINYTGPDALVNKAF